MIVTWSGSFEQKKTKYGIFNECNVNTMKLVHNTNEAPLVHCTEVSCLERKIIYPLLLHLSSNFAIKRAVMRNVPNEINNKTDSEQKQNVDTAMMRFLTMRRDKNFFTIKYSFSFVQEKKLASSFTFVVFCVMIMMF